MKPQVFSSAGGRLEHHSHPAKNEEQTVAAQASISQADLSQFQSGFLFDK